MDGIELRRFELKSTLIREQERKETLKVKHFNQLISASELEVKKKEEKISGLKLSISKEGLNSEPVDKLKAVRFLLNEIRSAQLEKKGFEHKLLTLNAEKASVVDNIINLKNKISKIDDLVADKKNSLKIEAESVALQDILESRVGAQRGERLKPSKVIEEDSYSSLNFSSDLLESPAIATAIEPTPDASFYAGSATENRQSARHEENPRQSNSSVTNFERAWQDIRSEVKGIESKTTDAGSEVSLRLNGECGNDLRVNIEKRGEKVVRVRIETTDAIDQRKLWAKKSEIISALDKAGYTVESVNVGSVKL